MIFNLILWTCFLSSLYSRRSFFTSNP